MNTLYISKLIAYAIQIISTIIVIYAYFQEIPPEHSPLIQALGLETIVQIIQVLVYTWLIIQFRLASMASTRYFDWIITTPLLLLAFIIYLNYEDNQANKTNEEPQTIVSFIQENKKEISIVLIANGLMLLFGLLGELGYVSKGFATISGFIALLVVFGVIYTIYASKSEIGTIVFVPFASIWSIYGVSYNFGEINKNLSYNILDTISKNLFGLFLAYNVLSLA